MSEWRQAPAGRFGNRAAGTVPRVSTWPADRPRARAAKGCVVDAFDWPFKQDFDWSQIPSDPGPPEWVRNWRWLADHVGEESAEYLQECDERGMAPSFGVVPYVHRDIEMQPVSDGVVLDEFGKQQTLITCGLDRFRLSPATHPGDGPCPLTGPVAFVSLSHPMPTRHDSGGLLPVPDGWPVAGAIDGRKRWTDRMVVAAPGPAMDRARATGQPFVLVWRPGHGHGSLEVVDVGTGCVLSSTAAVLTRATVACPMIPGAPCGQLCKKYGGPWVAQSIRGSARWSAERANRLADVGCDTCGDGAIRVIPIPATRPRVLPGDDWRELERVPYWPAATRYAEVVVT